MFNSSSSAFEMPPSNRVPFGPASDAAAGLHRLTFDEDVKVPMLLLLGLLMVTLALGFSRWRGGSARR